MKKKTFIILISFITLCSGKTIAQKETKKGSFGFGIELGEPMGNLSNAYSATAGLTLRYSLHVGPGFATLTTGLIGFAPKTGRGTPKQLGIQVPVRAGYKYIIQHHFFIMGELGYSYFKYYYQGSDGKVASGTRTALTFAPSAGLQFNAFEIGLRYGLNLTNNDGGILALRIGFNF
jgi:hypothetical protein